MQIAAAARLFYIEKVSKNSANTKKNQVEPISKTVRSIANAKRIDLVSDKFAKILNLDGKYTSTKEGNAFINHQCRIGPKKNNPIYFFYKIKNILYQII